MPLFEIAWFITLTFILSRQGRGNLPRNDNYIFMVATFAESA